MHICIYVYNIYKYNLYMYIRICVICISVYVYISLSVCICVYVHIYIYVYLYICLSFIWWVTSLFRNRAWLVWYILLPVTYAKFILVTAFLLEFPIFCLVGVFCQPYLILLALLPRYSTSYICVSMYIYIYIYVYI